MAAGDLSLQPVSGDPWGMVDTPGALPLTSQDQAASMMDQIAKSGLVQSVGNALSLPGRALYGPDAAGYSQFGPATNADALNAATWVTMPGIGRAALGGAAERDLMSMSGGADKAPGMLGSEAPHSFDLVVARKMPDGTVRYGQPMDTHGDLIGPRETSVDDSQMGFAQPGGKFMTRQEAQKHVENKHGFDGPQDDYGLEAALYHKYKEWLPEWLPAEPTQGDPFADK